ncbi:CPBP family intramembrane metalloprotease [Nonomuraea fuscirosea]|uniref:CPBP family intramembrane glutamic endopeptidase n=1 Tax=Nonomuraea fuscirosea TaxID=1291556 RepID=UPI002DD84D0C|nr:CPBP family intramembrane glutamic endopeptidase [Nonomuraea fuscirosea]WSA51482.1 CPBP family intramembrane metalloprotease [Nonomuraea fuscirosea]
MASTEHQQTLPQAGPSAARSRLRTFRFPVLLVAMFAVMTVIAGINQLVSPVPVLALPVGVGLAVAAIVAYRRLSRAVELRSDVPELDKADRRPRLRRGTLLGLGLFTGLMALIAVFGGWQAVSWGSIGGALGAAGMMASVAVAEELLFRGVLFRIMEERLGTVISLVVSMLVFGATHLVNANATLWGVLSIALTGGVMLAAAYVATRSLWLPIGLHFAWNFTHTGIFGVSLSGSDSPVEGLLNVTLSGPSALTGGVFGPEASLLALVVCLVPTIALLRRAKRTGQIKSRTRSS